MPTATETAVKVAILLPDRYDIAALCRARNLARLLRGAVGAGGERASVVIGLPDLPGGQRREAEEALREEQRDVVVRPLLWEGVPVGNARRMFVALDTALDLDGIGTLVVPRDWGWNFADCDIWISMADPASGAVLPLRPTAHFCRDLAVRIVPDAFATGIADPYWSRQTEAFRLWRQSDVVATSDADTIADLIGFAGVRRERTDLVSRLLPHDFVSAVPHRVRDAERLLWWVEPSALHDLANAIEGLMLYRAEGGALEPLIVGEAVDAFERDAASAHLADLPARVRRFMTDLPRQVIRSAADLSRAVAGASVLWSSLLAGGDGAAATAAAQGGAHFVGLDFATNRHAAETDGEASGLYARSRPIDIAEALHGAEARARTAPPAAFKPPEYRSAIEECGFFLDRLLEMTRG